MAIRRGLTSTLAYVILVFLGLFFLVPLLWPVLASLNPSASLSVTVPAHFSLINFQTIITNGLVAGPFGNSLILAISTMLLVIILACLAAYPLSRCQPSYSIQWYRASLCEASAEASRAKRLETVRQIGTSVYPNNGDRHGTPTWPRGFFFTFLILHRVLSSNPPYKSANMKGISRGIYCPKTSQKS